MKEGNFSWIKHDGFEPPSSSSSFATGEKLDHVIATRHETRSVKWMRLIIAILTVISIFALTTFVFYQEIAFRQPNNIPSKHPEQEHPIPNVAYNESIPSKPQLRDTNEYILSPSWKITSTPTTREHFWTITEGNLNPDGIFRPMLLINNQFPGPLVECNENA